MSAQTLSRICALLEFVLPVGAEAPEAFFNDLGPWQYSKWKAITGTKCAPWHSSATPLSTGLTSLVLMSIQRFLRIVAGPTSREAQIHLIMAESSTPGLREGRDHLSCWMESAWKQWGIDESVDKVLEREGLVVASRPGIDQLQVHFHARFIRPVAVELFGPEVVSHFGTVNSRTARWVSRMLSDACERWRELHDARKHVVVRVLAEVHSACEAVSSPRCTPEDVCNYLHHFQDLTGQFKLLSNDRADQQRHYENILQAMKMMALQGRAANKPMKLPCYLRRTLEGLSTEYERQRIIKMIDNCLRVVRGEVTPESFPPRLLGGDLDFTLVPDLFAALNEVNPITILAKFDILDPGLNAGVEAELSSLEGAEDRAAMELTLMTLPFLQWEKVFGMLRFGSPGVGDYAIAPELFRI